ncbi:large-conductance mechanosensitive channel protein MscL [Chloroflexota bacterium]
MLKEFRDFISKGNVLDLAVAVIIGGAFGAIVNSFVDDIVMPLVGVIIGGIDFTGLTIDVGEAHVLYGNFIQAIINFLVIAAAMFIVVRSYNQLQKQDAAKEALSEPGEEVKLLTEIRDLLEQAK